MDYNQNYYYGESSTPVVEKKSKKPLIIGIVIGVAVIAAVVILLINILGGPVKKIYNAFEKTVEKGPFAVEFEFDAGSEGSIDGEGIIELNKEEKYLAFDIEADDGYDDYRVIFYDNCMAMIEGSDEDDIYYENIADEDVEFIFDLMSEIDVMNPGKIDYEKIVAIIEEYTDGEVEIEIDEDVEECVDISQDIVEEYYKRFNDKEWLEACLGYEKDGSTYIFEPDFKELTDDLVVFVEDNEDSFEELFDKLVEIMELDSDDLDFDDLMDGLDELSDAGDEIQDIIDNFVIEITLDGGYISSIVFVIEVEDFELEGEILVSEYGDVEFDNDVEDIIDEGKEDVESSFKSYIRRSRIQSANANAKTVYTAAATYVTEYYENPDDAEELTPGCLYSGTIGEYDSDDDRSLMRSINKYMDDDAQGTYWAVYFDEYGNIEAAWWMDEDEEYIGCYPANNDYYDPVFDDWDTLIEDYQDNYSDDDYYYYY